MDLILKPIVVETPKILQNQQIYVHTEPTITKVRIGEVETLEPDEEAYVKSTQYSDETVLDIGVPKGFAGAKIVDVKFIDENETGTIYEFLFDDGQRVEILSPRGPKGDKGGTFDLGEEVGTAYEGNKGKANADAIFSNTTNINNILKEQSEQNSQIESNKKEVHNIKQALLQNEVLVVSKIPNKTTTRITAGGENIVDDQYTAVTEIKGSTVRNENLIPYPYENVIGVKINFPFTFEGITITNDNGVITANGTTGSYGSWLQISSPIKVKPNTKYFLSGCPSGGSKTGFYMQFNGRDESGTATNSNADDTGNGVSFTTSSTTTRCYIYISVAKNVTITNKVFKPLLVEGETGTWTPPFSDLKHAYIKSIKSTGRNLFDLNLLSPYITKNSEDENYFKFKVSPSTISEFKLFDEPKNIYAKIKYKAYDTTRPANERGAFPMFIRNDGTKYELSTYLNRDGEERAYIENVVAVDLTFGSHTLNTIGEFIISFEDVPYEPYTEELYQLPETLELGEWDSFNPQTGEITRQTKQITLNPDNVSANTNSSGEVNHFTYKLGSSVLAVSTTEINAISNLYNGITNSQAWGYGGAPTGISAASDYIRIRDKSFTDLQSFKDYLTNNPLIVDYKLATPTIEKILNTPKLYKAWNKGRESVIQGEIDNSIYGAMPTITNEYILKIGGEE